ncbi:MAG: hypothetical protein H0U15_05750 [Geodermatophilaceae bacterium]|jgi:hypothetical protein|nr:hypothetical protein [Geodermatophilaceae bacterium]
MATKTGLVELSDIHTAVSALEDDAERGTISAAEASKRINDSRRAVTPRELWKASGGRAGARKRSDWGDIRKTVFGAGFLMVLAAVGVWIVTIYTGKAVGSEEDYIREPSISVPADQGPEEPRG